MQCENDGTLAQKAELECYQMHFIRCNLYFISLFSCHCCCFGFVYLLDFDGT
jgi:hypothetical protein